MVFHEFFSVVTVIWLFPIMFMLHDLEEIITVESFMTKYKNKAPKTFLAKIALSVKKTLGEKSSQLSISAAWILLVLSCITFVTVFLLPSGENFLLFTAALNVFFLQAFSHLGQTIIFRGYTPGVLTALVLVVPYSLLTYYLIFEMGLIDGILLFKSLPLSLIMIPIFLIGNFLGRRLIR